MLHDPMAVFSFEDNEVIIPGVVLEEMDTKKRNMDEVGRNARYFSRLIDQYRQVGKLHEGVPLENGGMLRVELNFKSFNKLESLAFEMSNDNRMIATALNLHEEQQALPNPKRVILVSKDALVRVKADALGLEAEDFLSDKVAHTSESYTGYTELNVEKQVIDEFYQDKSISCKQCETYMPLDRTLLAIPHHFILFKDVAGGSASAVGKIDETAQQIELLSFEEDHVWGVKPRNVQQKMALQLLLDDSIPLVTMTGSAGTGKTLLSLAAGLFKVEDEQEFQKLLVARPIVPMGNDIGYLPGEKDEKLRPWMQPIFDNLEYLFHTKQKGDLNQILSGMKSIEVEALTYIRGRSIPDQFIIIDEAQNLTRHEVKTIITRVGEGSKIIFMGDPEQIDHPYLDETSNGLSYLVEKFKEQRISGHIRLQKGERSPLAQLAAQLL